MGAAVRWNGRSAYFGLHKYEPQVGGRAISQFAGFKRCERIDKSRPPFTGLDRFSWCDLRAQSGLVAAFERGDVLFQGRFPLG